MVRAESDIVVSLTSDRKRLYLRLGPKTYSLSPRKAFSLAHELLLRKRYASAARVYEALLRAGTVGPRAAIMLAYCRAAQKDYTSCNALLRTLFPGESEPVAEGLHTAFVYSDVGLRPEAIRELSKIVRERPDLPTTCLLLGDLFAASGQRDKAVLCWRLAIARDRADGSVARAAQRVSAILARGSKESAPRRGSRGRGEGGGRTG